MATAGRTHKSHGAGRVSLRKQGKYWHARCSYQGERRFLALRVTNVERAEDMAREISDEMLDEFAIVGTCQDLAEKILQRYDGLVDRLSLYDYLPTPGDEKEWRPIIKAING